MEDKTNFIESLFDKVTDYGKTSYELVKLKAIDKASDVVSTIIPHSIILVIGGCFMLFLNLGIAFWLGEILEKVYYGFLVVAAFYCFLAIVLQLFMHKWIKKCVQNYFIKKVLN
jgi:hypothetical protein